MRFSVVIPTRNRALKLARALESAINASEVGEVIVSDNASSDETPSVIEQYRSQNANLLRKVRSDSDLGMVGNWNQALKEATGDWILILCDDDSIERDFFIKARSFIEAHNDVSLIAFGRTEIKTDGSQETSSTRKTFPTRADLLAEPDLLRLFVRHENILGPPSAVLFSRKALERATLRGEVFSTRFQYATDWAAWMNLARGHQTGLIHDSLVRIDMHQSNLTLRAVDEGTDLIEVSTLRRVALARLKSLNRPTFFLDIELRLSIGYRFFRRFARLVLRGRPLEIAQIARRFSAACKAGQSAS